MQTTVVSPILEPKQGPALTMSTSSRGSSPAWAGAPAGTAFGSAAGSSLAEAEEGIEEDSRPEEGRPEGSPDEGSPEEGRPDEGSPEEGSPEGNHCGDGKKRSVLANRELFGQRRIGADILLRILRHGFGGRGGVIFVDG